MTELAPVLQLAQAMIAARTTHPRVACYEQASGVVANGAWHRPLYVSVAGLVPGIVEKACRVDEEREDPPTHEGWLAGGVVRRVAGRGLTT